MTDLFETKFKRGLRRADRAISEQMDLVDVSMGHIPLHDTHGGRVSREG